MEASDFRVFVHFADAEAEEALFTCPSLFKGTTVACMFNGHPVDATLDFPARFELQDTGGVEVDFICSSVAARDVLTHESETGSDRVETTSEPEWEFFLPYIGIDSFDSATSVDIRGFRGWRTDIIHLSVGGCAWVLRKMYQLDEVYYGFEEGILKCAEANRPVSDLRTSEHCTLSVSTTALDQRSAEDESLDICWLLGLALAQRVAWSHLSLKTRNASRFVCKRSYSLPTEPSTRRLISNRERGTLAGFVADAEVREK